MLTPRWATLLLCPLPSIARVSPFQRTHSTTTTSKDDDTFRMPMSPLRKSFRRNSPPNLAATLSPVVTSYNELTGSGQASPTPSGPSSPGGAHSPVSLTFGGAGSVYGGDPTPLLVPSTLHDGTMYTPRLKWDVRTLGRKLVQFLIGVDDAATRLMPWPSVLMPQQAEQIKLVHFGSRRGSQGSMGPPGEPLRVEAMDSSFYYY